MPQYQEGLASINKGSDVLLGLDTEWMYEISPGDLFILDDDPIIYRIKTVVSDDELELEEPYKGETRTGPYSITRDFTSNIRLPIFYRTDKSTRALLKYSIIRLEDYKFGNYLIQDNIDSIILNQGSSINPDDLITANQEDNFTFWEEELNTITNVDLPQAMGM